MKPDSPTMISICSRIILFIGVFRHRPLPCLVLSQVGGDDAGARDAGWNTTAVH